MLKGIKNGAIDTVIVKDMSRFGRDYIKVGEYMEKFRKLGIRLIAINDNVDSFKREDDFTPFRNIMNEWYAKDASRKIKSAFRAKGKSGKPTANNPPYGYIKNPNDKNKWIIDEDAAKVVKRIFQLTMEGAGPYNIATTLENEKVECPGYHLKKLGYGNHQKKDFDNPYKWWSSTVASILKKEEYLGNTVNFKTRKHYKDKKSHYVDEDEWEVYEDTHKPIIDRETFDNVQRIRGNAKRYLDGWGKVHPLTGLLYCADCGSKMYVHRTSNYSNVAYYTCSAYTKVPCGTKCETAHRIKSDNVITLIAETLNDIKSIVGEDMEGFISSLSNEVEEKNEKEYKINSEKLIEKEKRNMELEKLICRIYEDMTLGKIPEQRYEILNGQYSKEQEKLQDEIKVIKKEMEGYETASDGIERFVSLIERYENFDNLTNTMLNEFVYKVLVHERERKGLQDSPQKIEIFFNFIGNYEPLQEELSEEELRKIEEEEKEKEELRQRLHENYLKRKKSGHQKKYEESYKERRKELREKKKEKLVTYGIPVSEIKKKKKAKSG